jgi:phosphoribosylformylglycinamidine synthase
VIHFIEVANRPEFPDPHARGLPAEAATHGWPGLRAAAFARVYLVEGDLGPAEAERIAREVLADPLVERASVGQPLPFPEFAAATPVLITRRSGVMDPVEESALKAIADLGLRARRVRTARKYRFLGDLAPAALRAFVERALANPVVEEILWGEERPPLRPVEARERSDRGTVPLAGADDARLVAISRERGLSLSAAEMRAIRDFFGGIARAPTEAELLTLAQTWSEHCKHKTLRARVDLDGRRFENLLKDTVMRATEELASPHVLSAFVDNAGVLAFDERHGIAVKVETHNHPSAIEPYGGAGTGVGGVIRDVLGTGLGARPILNLDFFCLGPPDLPPERVPKGALHPRVVLKGVVAGVRDYGNRMGIPTACGGLVFDERYVGNPLVYCGTVGLIPRDRISKAARPLDRIVVVGGRTGRDGIGGATFSSVELTEASETVSASSVQIGNPITEKKVLDALLQVRDRGLASCVTDCGAGGLSSAIGETAEETGAEVDLDAVPLKYEGLTGAEIWLSEAQERMVLAVPPARLDEVLAICRDEDVEATVVGTYTDTRRLVVRRAGATLVDLPMEFLHHGLPKLERRATWTRPRHPEPDFAEPEDLGAPLLRLLAHPDIGSREPILRQYDHEVQGGLALKPLQGPRQEGPGDGIVVAPILSSRRGLAVACGIRPRYADVDPRAMALCAVDEALRNLVAAGAPLDQAALLDNFCWGSTATPEAMGALARACVALYDAARGYRVPFISGKDSLNNEFAAGGRTLSIPPTILVTAIAVMPDLTRAVSMDLKQPGNLLWLVGTTAAELGGSHWFALHGALGNQVPEPDPARARALLDAVAAAAAAGLVRSAHDLSEGGLGVAAAEMALGGDLGAELALADVPLGDAFDRDDFLLFSESCPRFLLEVEPGRERELARALEGFPAARVGAVTGDGRLRVRDRAGRARVDLAVADLRRAWHGALRW